MSFSPALLSGDQIVKLRSAPRELINFSGPKEYRPDTSWLEQKQIRVCLENKRNCVGNERVEKIQNLSKAEWVSNLNKARVVKKVGKHWEIFGHAKDNEDWLFAEEALFLLETCSLELTLNGVPLSVEQSYALLLGGVCSLDEYRVYAHLLKKGFRVLRHDVEVRVTRYEKDISLDQVVEGQKRSIPGEKQSSVEESDPGVDVEETRTARKELNDVIFLSESSNISSDVIVLNASDSEEEEKDDQTTPSSTNDLGRHWYYSKKDWVNWQDEIEEIVDCEKDGKKFDFYDTSQKPIRDILRSLPNVKSGITIITCPDQRLIPQLIHPKHFQYRVNLMRSSHTSAPENRESQKENIVVHDLTGDDMDSSNEHPAAFNQLNFAAPLHPVGVNPQLITNSILTQAHSIQIMAMGMIRSSLQMLSSFHGPQPFNQNYTQPRSDFNVNNARLRYGGNVTKRPWWRSRGFQRRGRGGGGGARRYFRPKRRQNDVKPQSKSNVIVVVDDDDEEPATIDSDPDEILEVTPPEKKQKLEIVDLDSSPNSPDVEDITQVDSKEKESDDHPQPGTSSSMISNNEPSRDSTIVGESSSNARETGESSSQAVVVVDLDDKDEDVIVCDKEPEEAIKMVDNQSTTASEQCNEDSKAMDVDYEESSSPQQPSLQEAENSEGCEALQSWEQFKLTSEFAENIDRVEVTPLNNSTTCTNLGSLLQRLQIFSPIPFRAESTPSRLKISFDLYPPNEHFKKSLKQLPKYRVVVMRSSHDMPTFHEMNHLKLKFEDDIAFLFAIVYEDGLSFFIFDFIDLPVYCEP